MPSSLGKAQEHIAGLQQKGKQRIQTAKNAIQLLDQLILEMSRLDEEEAVWIKVNLGKEENNNLLEAL
jgi:hypothetical protein